eukprot:Clim_evm71s149 gene=Clim_evmTU71s149
MAFRLTTSLFRDTVPRLMQTTISTSRYNGTKIVAPFFMCRNYALSATDPVPAEKLLKDGDLKLTDAAIKRLEFLRKDNPELMLRVAIDSGGCSGYQYAIEETTEIEDEDLVYDNDGIRVVVDEATLDGIKGSTVDYKQELIMQKFVVSENPQAEAGCSCGASFAMKF